MKFNKDKLGDFLGEILFFVVLAVVALAVWFLMIVLEGMFGAWLPYTLLVVALLTFALLESGLVSKE